MATNDPIYVHLSPGFPQDIIDLVRMHKIKMVYWDLGGTIVDLSPAIKERAVKKINLTYHREIDVEMFDQAIRVEWSRRENRKATEKIKSVDDDRKEKEYWIEFYARVLENLGVRVRIRDRHLVKWLATVQANPKSFEKLPFIGETLELLIQMNIQIGIISNAFPSAKRILKDKGLFENFNEQHIILSYEYNSIKPEGSIYREAINRANVKPDEILFIDDRKSFVDGATKNGMNAVVISDIQGKEPSDSGRPKSGTIEQYVRKLLLRAWLVGHRFKQSIIRLARSNTGSLWHQSIQSRTESSLPRPGMWPRSVKLRLE